MQAPPLKRRCEAQATILPDGYVALLVPSTNWVYTLTPLGGLVWELCDGHSSVDDIVKSLDGSPDIPPEPNRHTKVAELIGELQTLGLLVEKCGEADGDALQQPGLAN